MRLHLLSWIFTIFTSLSSFGLVSGCQDAPPQAERPLPLPQDPFVQVYFNQNQAQGADYTDPYRQITRPGDNLEQIIIEAIAAATSTIDVAVQELRLPKIAQALVERHQAGVKVRVVLENSYSRPLSEFSAAKITALSEEEQRRYQEFFAWVDQDKNGKLSSEEIDQGDALIILRKGGIPIIDDTADGSKGTGLMHHKFMVIDDYTILTGSTNLTLSGVHGDYLATGSRGNANHLLQIKDIQVAQAFTEEFNFLWGDGVGGKSDSRFGVNKPYRLPQTFSVGETTLTVQFSPTSASKVWSQSSNGLIGRTLETAEESVNLALFVFSEQKFANILNTLNQDGAKIQVIIDPSFAFRYYSEGLDLLGVAVSNKCSYEVDNRPWSPPITTMGVPKLPPGDKLHHKVAILDQKTVITGSQNWSAAANNTNDETVLIIQSSQVADHFEREFARLFDKATLGVPGRIQEKIQQQEQDCTVIDDPLSTDSLGQVVNVNTASVAELETLPGIGPKIAQRIIETRQEKPFTSLEDLERVPGIGPSIRRNLDGRVTW